MQHIPVHYVEVLLNHFHIKDKTNNSTTTSQNKKSKGRFFSINVYRFLQIFGPTSALQATGLKCRPDKFLRKY